MLKRSSSLGVTLIELMIGVAIVSMLLLVGLPAMSAWMANTRVRNFAEGIQTGLAVARSEAIRRNRNVEFLLTNDTIDLGSVATVAPAANGIHWLVRTIDPATGLYAMLDSKSGQEGSGRADVASGVQVAASAPLVVFAGFGATQGLGAAATFDLSSPGAGACNTATTPGPVRCLRVQLSVGGQIRVCDPSTSGSDSRAC